MWIAHIKDLTGRKDTEQWCAGTIVAMGLGTSAGDGMVPRNCGGFTALAQQADVMCLLLDDFAGLLILDEVSCVVQSQG